MVERRLSKNLAVIVETRFRGLRHAPQMLIWASCMCACRAIKTLVRMNANLPLADRRFVAVVIDLHDYLVPLIA